MAKDKNEVCDGNCTDCDLDLGLDDVFTFEDEVADLYVDALVDAHWGYINNLLDAHGESPESIDIIKFHYKTAFVHGYKHGREDAPTCESCQQTL